VERVADDLRDVDVALGRDLAGDDDQPGVDQALAGDPPARVVAHHRVEDAVGDLVADLVRVALGDRLRGEQMLAVGKPTPCSPRNWYRTRRETGGLI
jgi:hypothetical protein